MGRWRARAGTALLIVGLLAAIATLLRGEPDGQSRAGSDLGQTPATASESRAPVPEQASPSPAPMTGLAMPSEHAPSAQPSAAEAREARLRPVPSPDGRGEVAAGELLVVPHAGREQTLEAALRTDPDVAGLRELPVAGARWVRLSSEASLGRVLERMRGHPDVLDATPNAIVRATGKGRGGRGRGRPQDDARREPTGREITRASWNVRSMHLPPERRRRGSADGEPSVIALLDSGVAAQAHSHDDGAAHAAAPGLRDVEIVAPFDAVAGDDDPADHNGHGTFLANLLVGRPGLARDAALMPVRVLDDELVGTEAWLVSGLIHAVEHGADVINLSLVFGERYLPTRLLDAAITEAVQGGAIVVAAAGNDGDAAVRYPAAFRDVLAVGASTPKGPGRLEPASYSSHGSALDLLAPGGDLDADRNRDGIADGIVAESFDPSAPDVYGPWLYAGTSQAAAHASAAVTWLLDEGVERSEIGARLRHGARDIGAPRFDEDTGGGVMDVLRATARAHRPVDVGVQLVAVLRDGSDGPAVGAVLTVRGRDGEPVAGADAFVTFREAEHTSARCTTDKAGTCHLDGIPLMGTRLSAVVQAHAVVLRDGRVVRPRAVAPAAQMDRALGDSGGTGFGSSSILWLVDPDYSSSWWAGSLTSYQLYGSGEGSSLAPTVVALDEASMEELTGDDGDTGGTGFGSSSTVWSFYYWQPSYDLGYTWGGGFGSSSLVWSGWSFQWGGWGSALFDTTAASLDMEAASRRASAASHGARRSP